MPRKHLKASGLLKHLYGRAVQVGEHRVSINASGEVHNAPAEVYQALRQHEHWSVVKGDDEARR